MADTKASQGTAGSSSNSVQPLRDEQAEPEQKKSQLTIGLLGGISYVSTVDYYTQLNRGVGKALGGLHSSRIVMCSVDLAEYAALLHASNWAGVSQLLLRAAKSIDQAGADVLLICSNTGHLVAPALQRDLPGLPLLHIADTTAAEIKRRQGVNKSPSVGFLGTKFTMENAHVVIDRLKSHGIRVMIPESQVDRDRLQSIIEDELSHGVLDNVASLEFVVSLIRAFVQQGAGGVVLGCTEIPLLVNERSIPEKINLYDTGALHISGALQVQLQHRTLSSFLPS